MYIPSAFPPGFFHSLAEDLGRYTEDLIELVLGMTSPTLFRELFPEAGSVSRESLDEWFDTKTTQFGGQEVIETVRELVGHTAKFDFQEVSADIPQIDLPSLAPFSRSMLSINGRRTREAENGISFLTPDAWLNNPGMRKEYRGLTFNRMDRSDGATLPLPEPVIRATEYMIA